MNSVELRGEIPVSTRAAAVLEQLARIGLYLHAAFLPISIAGMQAGLAVSAICLAALGLMGRRIWTRSAVDLPVAVLIGAALLSQVLALSWAGNEATLWRTFLSPLIIVSVIGLDPERARGEALKVFGIWAVASLLPGAVAWIQHYRRFDPLFELGLRRKAVVAHTPLYEGRFSAVGFFQWYQRLAHNLTPPLCVLGALIAFGGLQRRLRIAGAIVLAVGLAAVFLTFARSAWYGLALAVFVGAMFAGKRFFFGSCAIGALAVAVLMAVNPGFHNRVVTSFDSHTNSDRMGIWKTCAAVVEDHPFTGVGFGALPSTIKPYFARISPDTKIQAWCHNTFYSAYAEGGPLLTLAAAFFFGYLAWRFLRDRAGTDRLGKAAAVGGLTAVAAMLVNAMAHDFFYASESMYGLGFGLAMAAVLVVTGRRSSEA